MKNKAQYIGPVALALISISVGLLFPLGRVGHAQSIDELTQQIDQKRKEISDLEQQKSSVEGELNEKEAKVNTVQGQLSLVENSITAATIDIQESQTELEKINLEIDQTEQRIKQKQDLIDDQKGKLAELLRAMYRQKNRTVIDILLSDQTFSDFFRTIKATTNLEVNTKDEITKLASLKHDLEVQQENLNGKKTELEESQAKLKQQQLALTQQQAYQQDLLDKLNASKGETLATLDELNGELSAIKSSALSLESSLRQQLYDQYGISPEFSGQFAWPVNSRRITAYYHDPSYPFSSLIGSHSGLDIGVPQGTPVMAASDGIVVQVDCGTDYLGTNPCPNSRELALVTILHGNNEFQTRYLHLSQIYVHVQQVVKQGDIIGLSGALPGSYGAGYFTTGAHLHFEVKKPCSTIGSTVLFCTVDPLQYLP